MVESEPHILIIDDDDRIRALLKRYLYENGVNVSTARDALEARQLMCSLVFDAFIVDVMMPGETGFEFTLALKKKCNVPVLLLTARGQPEDRIKGLELGADDYLSKPFEPKELLLRVKNLLQHQKSTGARRSEFTFGRCRFHKERGELHRDGVLVKLTSSELSLLRALVTKPGEPVSRYDLAEGNAAAMERSVDVQVTRLRKKIEDNPRTPILLQTIRGIGYALMVD